MASPRTYVKPSMTNLPRELGRAIFQQILNTPAPNRKKMREEADKLEKEMLKARIKVDPPPSLWG